MVFVRRLQETNLVFDGEYCKFLKENWKGTPRRAFCRYLLQGSRSGSKPRKTSPGTVGGLYTSKDIKKMVQEILENGFILLMMPKIIINIYTHHMQYHLYPIFFAESSVETRFLELGCIQIQHQHSTNRMPLSISIWLVICQLDGHRQSNKPTQPTRASSQTDLVRSLPWLFL